MAAQKKIIGRKYVIGENEYIIYKEGTHVYVKLDKEIVFSSKENQKLTISQWLKSMKK
jgi:hypothetical protein